MGADCCRSSQTIEAEEEYSKKNHQHTQIEVNQPAVHSIKNTEFALANNASLNTEYKPSPKDPLDFNKNSSSLNQSKTTPTNPNGKVSEVRNKLKNLEAK